MHRPIVALAFLALIVSAMNTALADSSAARMPDASWLAGSWKCVSQLAAMGNAPAHTETSTMTFQPVLNGAWLEQSYAGKGYALRGFWRFEKPAHSWTFISADSLGEYGIEHSSAVMQHGGNILTLSGSIMLAGQKMSVMDYMTRRGETLEHVGKMMQNGKWTQGDKTTCTRNG